MKTGIIKGIQPNGGYQSQNGYINTSMMTIEVVGEGQITGEIGSKSQPYPMNVGEEISFEFKNTTHGTKIKKVNPQYAQGDSQGQQNQSQGQNSGGRDYDAENRGKCRFGLLCAYLQGGKTVNFVDIDSLVEYSMTGQHPGPAPQGTMAKPIDDDDIPF